MKFKLDENLGLSIQKILSERGHDCRTVLDEDLSGAPDDKILVAAHTEERVLVTTDHDFGNVVAYPPEERCGIAIINPPGRSSLKLLRALILTLLEGLKRHDIKGRLWIIEPGRIREHETSG